MRRIPKQVGTQARRGAERVIADIRPHWLKPTSIHFSLTYRCNLNCRQCDIPLTGKKDRAELTTEQVCTALSQLKEWLGKFHVNFAGGEPFIRRDILDLVEFSSRNGISVNITTNGLLIDEKKARRIERSGINSLNISLDGMRAETHDHMRNRRGSYKKTMEVVERLNRPRDYCLVIATILNSQNMDEVLEMVDWVEANNLNGIIFQPLYSTFGRPFSPDWWRNNEFWPATEEELERMDTVLDRLIKGKKRGSPVVNSIRQLESMRWHFHHPQQANKRELPRCRVDTKNFAINEYGDALLCFWLDPIGNILEDHPRNLWNNALAQQRRKQIKQCRLNCSVLNCHFD